MTLFGEVGLGVAGVIEKQTNDLSCRQSCVAEGSGFENPCACEYRIQTSMKKL